MSGEDTENTLENKLMGILQEEISALKLGEVKKKVENEYVNDSDAREIKADAVGKREAFSSSSDNAADVLLKNDDQNEVKCKPEDLNPPSENVAGGEIMRQTNYQDRATEYTQKEEAFNLKSEKEAENMLQQMKSENQKSCMNDMESFAMPCDNLSEEILQRTEFYFQDFNIFKNSFLLKHIRRNKKGYVSLKLVSSLRKIKALTKDFRVVAYSLKKSKILELNPECTKIRRIEPIPKIEDTSFGKTVMIFNLPQQNQTKAGLRELFSKFGTIVSVGVFQIKTKDCDVYHERCLCFHHKIASKTYGIVEFEKYDDVVNALKDEEDQLPKENEIKVVPLMPQIYKKEKRHLKFLEQYNRYPRGGYGRFRPRNEPRVVPNEIPPKSGDDLRNGKVNEGSYQYNRGVRRPSRGRRYYMPPNTKKYSDSQYPNDYNGMKNNKWSESRHLKANNSYNIDHIYPNVYRKKHGNGYVENGVPI